MRIFAFFLVIAFFFVSFENAYGLRQDSPSSPDKVRAVYLAADYMTSPRKIAELEHILLNTNANAIVIDFKDGITFSQDYMTELVARFKKNGIYTIARIVTFQDSVFARKHPEVAVRTSSGTLWYSGRVVWRRYWLDPASSIAQEYNIQIAKRAIDAGFDEIQFDYMRFPTDGNMRDIRYPVFNPKTQSKNTVIAAFAEKAHDELKTYSPKIVLSADLFGEVFIFGSIPAIGQNIYSLAQYFDVLSPMAYPSHYNCGSFGVHDPNAHPYKVYYETLSKGLTRIRNTNVIVRPWVQDFSIRNIYACGPKIYYTRDMVYAQIKAGKDLGINGFMLWNAASRFTDEVF